MTRTLTRGCSVTAALIALAGCGNDEVISPVPTEGLTATLDLDIRDQANVVLSVSGDELEAKLTVTKGYGVVPEATELRGSGSVERFPEAEMALFVARFSVPA